MSIHERVTTFLTSLGILIAMEMVVNKNYFWFTVNCINESFRPTMNHVRPSIYLDSFPLYRYSYTVLKFPGCVTDSTMIKTKKYQLNYNTALHQMRVHSYWY